MAAIKGIEDPNLRAAYNAALKTGGPNSQATLAARAKLNANRQAVGLNINVNQPGVKPPGTITNQKDVTNSGYGDLTAANSAFVDSLAKIGQGAEGARDANYNYLTKDFAANKAQDTTVAQQTLAERGIPIDYSNDPNAPTLYQKSMNDINKNYQNQYDQAGVTALDTGEKFYNDSVNNASTLGGVADNFINTLSQSYVQKYGIDQQAATARAQMEVQKMIAAGQNKTQTDIANKKIAAAGAATTTPTGDTFLG